MQLRRMRAVGAVAAGAALLVGLGATGALAGDGGGGEEELPLESSPERGPLGTVITISGDSCTEPTIQFKLTAEDGEVVAEDEADVENHDPNPYAELYSGEGGGHDEDPVFGTFEGTITVPRDREDLIGQELAVNAICNPVYETRSFLVQEEEPPPPPPPPGGGGGGAGAGGGTGGAGGTTPTTSRPAAPARTAQPISGTPSFTG